MTGTTERVMVKEIGNALDPNHKSFEIDESGRTHALKVDLGDGEYNLFVFYQNKFFKTQFRYESIILQYFYSDKLGELAFIKSFNFTASDDSYVRLSDNKVVDESEALNDDGNLKDGYTTEAKYYESTIGPTIADYEEAAIKRKLNL